MISPASADPRLNSKPQIPNQVISPASAHPQKQAEGRARLESDRGQRGGTQGYDWSSPTKGGRREGGGFEEGGLTPRGGGAGDAFKAAAGVSVDNVSFPPSFDMQQELFGIV